MLIVDLAIVILLIAAAVLLATIMFAANRCQGDSYASGGAYDKMPYQRDFTSDDEIRAMFRRLQAFDPADRWVARPFKLRNVAIEPTTFEGQSLNLVVLPDDYAAWERLSDMFSERCRLRCRTFDRDQSPEELYHANPQRFADYAKSHYGSDTPKNRREAIYKLTRECTAHKPTHIIALMRRFGAKRIFDFTAGWGDRLIGAMAGGAEEYLGVDLNPCLVQPHREIVEFFAPTKTDKFRVVESAIEDFDVTALAGHFDLVFTSPPYFDLELYETQLSANNELVNIKPTTQSEQAWVDSFLTPALSKSWSVLCDQGVLAININQKSRNESYIDSMLRIVDEFEHARYLGVIAYSNQKQTNPQPIWLWRKDATPPPSHNNITLSRFHYSDVPVFARLTAKPENMAQIAAGRTMTYEQAANTVAKYIRGQYTYWLCRERSSGDVVGFIGYFDGHYLNRSLRGRVLSRIMIDSAHRRQGFGADAYKALMAAPGTPALTAVVAADNTASLKLSASVGFVPANVTLTIRGKSMVVLEQ